MCHESGLPGLDGVKFYLIYIKKSNYPYNSIFDLQYFMIGLLYLVFDAELVLILPWLLGVSSLSLLGLFSMFFFILCFIIGLIFE